MKKSLPVFLALIIPLLLIGQPTVGDYSIEIQRLSADIGKDSGNPELYFKRGEAYAVNNEFEKAVGDFKKVLELYSAKPQPAYKNAYLKSCYRLADYYFFRYSDRKEALKYVSEGLKVEASQDLEVMDAIILSADPNQNSIAWDKYRALSAKYPHNARLNLFHARFLKNSDPLAAAVLYEKVLTVEPFNKEALVGAGACYNNEAMRLSSGVVEDPHKVMVYAQKAADYFEKLLKLNPSDKEAANVLIAIYNELNEQGKAEQLKSSSPY